MVSIAQSNKIRARSSKIKLLRRIEPKRAGETLKAAREFLPAQLGEKNNNRRLPVQDETWANGSLGSIAKLFQSSGNCAG